MAEYLKAAAADEVMREQVAYLLWHEAQGCGIPLCEDCTRVRKVRLALLEPFTPSPSATEMVT